MPLKNITAIIFEFFSIKDFFSKCGQIRSLTTLWSHLLKFTENFTENFILCSDDCKNLSLPFDFILKNIQVCTLHFNFLETKQLVYLLGSKAKYWIFEVVLQKVGSAEYTYWSNMMAHNWATKVNFPYITLNLLYSAITHCAALKSELSISQLSTRLSSQRKVNKTI